MKKSFLIKILTIAFLACSTLFMLTACTGPTNNDETPSSHEHVYENLRGNEGEHWYECKCGEKSELQPHNTEKMDYNEDSHWFICECGLKVKQEEHLYNIVFNEEEHWYECYCGGTFKHGEHYSEAPANEKEDEICAECKFVMSQKTEHVHANNLTLIEEKDASCEEAGNIEYYLCSCGRLFKDENAINEFNDDSEVIIEKTEHNFTLQYHDWIHWYECDCGETEREENHVPGAPATETTPQKCTVCDYIYEQALGHIHTLHLTKVDPTASTCSTQGNIEYYACSCGKWFTTNTATTEITNKESVLLPLTEHDHFMLYDNKYYHWYECRCGDKTASEAHYGGTATCREPAYCIICGWDYGTVGDHSPSTNWTTTDSVHYKICTTGGCNEKLDYSAHNYNADKECTVCGYVTTALLGTEIASFVFEINGNNLYAKVPNNYLEFDFGNDIQVAEGATFKLFNAQNNQINNKLGELEVGDNIFYITVSTQEHITKTYTVTVRRKPMYTITFDSDGGNSVESQRVEEDGYVLAPNVSMQKEGYTFISWNYDFNNPIVKDTTILANWNINSYTLTIIYGNGRDNLVITQEYNSQIESILAPTCDGYTFKGWSDSIPSIMPSRDLTITAIWDANEYILTIVYDNGQDNLVLSIKYNSSIPYIDAPQKEGHLFIGWSEQIPSTMPAYDLTITARWQVKTYKITVKFNNGQEDLIIEQPYNTEITQSLPVLEDNRPGYGFTGWSQDMPTHMPGENITIKALWNAIYIYSTTGWINGLTEYGKTLTELVVPAKIDDTTITILRSAFSNAYLLTSIKLPNTITSIEGYTFSETSITTLEIPTSVTNIGSYAFYNCRSLTSLDIPNTVTSIGTSAFMNCTALVSVKLPSNLSKLESSLFSGCLSLEEVSIPSKVESISAFAFKNCDSLMSIVIPNSVKSIGYEAFKSCDSLTNIYVPATVSTIEKDAFKECPIVVANIPSMNINYWMDAGYLEKVIINSGTEIGDYSFNGAKITSIELPFNTTKIGAYAFSGCTLLTSIEIPNTVTSIGDYAFGSVDSVKSIEIPSSVESLGIGVFTYSDNLEEIVFADGCSFESLGKSIFYSCQSLKRVLNIPSTVLEFGDSAFYECIELEIVTFAENSQLQTIGRSAFHQCYNLSGLELPSTITAIGENAFYSCRKLTNLNITEDTLLESIGNYAFYDCEKLNEFALPTKLISIGKYAFYDCDLFTTIVIPSATESIGNDVFSECTSLVVIYCETENKPSGWVNNWNNNHLVVWNYKNNDVDVNGNIILEQDGVFYALKDGIAEVIGQKQKITTVNICKTITYNNEEYTVTRIGAYAFRYSLLESVVIPSTITYIASDAFYDSNLLEEVIFEEGSTLETMSSYAFAYCEKLTKIELPSTLKYLNDSWFVNCTKLIEIINHSPNFNIKKGEGIATYAIYVVNSSEEYVNKITTDSNGFKIFEDGNDKILVDYIGTATNVVIPNGITKISNAFVNNSTITSVVIPNTVTQILDMAFNGCISLVSVNIPNSVTTIGSYAFAGCVALESIVIPNTITTIGNNAFASCEALISVNLPNSVISLGTSVFSGCTALTSVNIPTSIKNIPNSTFNGCSALESITIPNYVESIGEYAFYSCNNLTTIIIERYSQLKTIGNYAFAYCKLTSIETPASLTTIGERAFYYCSSLEYISIENNGSLESIGSNAFIYCTKLLNITIPNTVKTIGSGAFSQCSLLTIFCEAKSKPDGFNSNWNSSNCLVVWDSLDTRVLEDGSIYATINGIRYSLKDDKATVLRQLGDLRTVNLPSSVSYNGKEYVVSYIAESAFAGFENLTSVVIPSTVIGVGGYAFYGSYAVTIYCHSNTQPSGWNSNWNTIDHNYSALPVVWNATYNDVASDGYIYITVNGIRYGLKDGKAKVARQVKYLTSVNIPATVSYKGNTYDVTVVDRYAFEYSPLLTTVTFDKDSKVELFDFRAFFGCDALTSITLPNSLVEISNESIRLCESLKEIVIPKSVKTIHVGAFVIENGLTFYCERKGVTIGWMSGWSDGCIVIWDYKG